MCSISAMPCAYYQYADNLWIAVGEFLGHQLRTVGSTAQKAARAWKKAATEKRLFGESAERDG
jgi:hypothetical protein